MSSLGLFVVLASGPQRRYFPTNLGNYTNSRFNYCLIIADKEYLKKDPKHESGHINICPFSV